MSPNDDNLQGKYRHVGRWGDCGGGGESGHILRCISANSWMTLLDNWVTSLCALGRSVAERAGCRWQLANRSQDRRTPASMGDYKLHGSESSTSFSMCVLDGDLSQEEKNTASQYTTMLIMRTR